MPRIIDPKQEYAYRLKIDRATGDEVTFYLKPLTHSDTLRLTQSFRVDARLAAHDNKAAIVMDMAEMKTRVFVERVTKVTGIVWPGTAEAVTVESEEDKKKLFEMLCDDDGREILEALEDMAILKEGEIKN